MGDTGETCPQRERRVLVTVFLHSLPPAKAVFDVATDCCYSTAVLLEWDEDKRSAKIRKHGIDFEEISYFAQIAN